MDKHIILNHASNERKVRLKDLLKKHELLVKFYSDHCGYCNEMQNDWNNAVHELEEKNPKKLIILEIEAEQMNNFEDDGILKSKVIGYPNIMFVKRNGSNIRHVPFNRERTAKQFVDFTLEHLKEKLERMKNKLNNTANNKKRKMKATKKKIKLVKKKPAKKKPAKKNGTKKNANKKKATKKKATKKKATKKKKKVTFNIE